MCVCMYVCMYTYVYVCICMYMYAYVCICMYMYVYVCMYVCKYTNTNMPEHAYMYFPPKREKVYAQKALVLLRAEPSFHYFAYNNIHLRGVSSNCFRCRFCRCWTHFPLFFCALTNFFSVEFGMDTHTDRQLVCQYKTAQMHIHIHASSCQRHIMISLPRISRVKVAMLDYIMFVSTSHLHKSRSEAQS